MSRNDHFADVFNYYLFSGKQKIRESKLIELDPAELSIILENDTSENIQKYRDVLKQCVIKEDEKASYLILGIENQSDIHYAMTIRNMLYDAVNYEKQVQKIAIEHRKKKDVHGSEFLSGFKKTDKLKPVITLTIYWGADHWDGPRTLHEMLQDVDEELLTYISDYKMNLIVPQDISDFSKFHTELGRALEFIASSEDEERIDRLSHNENFSAISNETANLLNVCTGTDFKLNEEGGSVNMCEGMRLFGEKKRDEGLSAGIIEGRIEAYFDVGFSPEKIAEKLEIPTEQVTKLLTEKGFI
jgi:hypothetical protein